MSEHIERAVDSYKKMNFYLEIDGITQTGFKTCDGLEKDWNITEERNGNEKNTNRKQRTRVSYSDITFTSGVTSESGALRDWEKTGERKELSIVQMDHNMNEVKRWDVENAFPKTFKPFDGMDADSDDVQVESLTIAHEGYEEV